MGGAETWLMEIIKALHNENESLKIEILVTSGELDVFDKEAKKLGIKIHYQQFSGKHSLNFIRFYRKLLKKKKYCAIHDHQEFLSGWHFLFGLGRLPKVRICHVHNPSYQLQTNYGISLKRRATIHLGMHLVKYLATDIRGTSKEVLDKSGYTISDYRSQTPAVLHCFFNVEKFKLNPEVARKKILCELDLPNDHNLLLFLGRLDYSIEVGHSQNHKNSAFALHVLSELKDKKVLLLFAGKNEYIAEEFMNKAKKLGVSNQIRLLGLRRDVPELLAAVDLLFFPSRSEGLGMVAVEAQMSGTRVLTSTAVPKECVVIHELVTFKDLKESYRSWADQIIKLTSPYDKLAFQNDQRIYNSSFNINVGLPKLLNLYTGRYN